MVDEIEENVEDAEVGMQSIESAQEGLHVKRESILSGLRSVAASKQRDRADGPTTTDVPIPGWDGKVVATYRVVSMRRLEKQNKILKNDKSKQSILVRSAQDTIILACAGIGVRDDIEDDPVPLDNEMPVKFEDRLTDMFELPRQRTARDIVSVFFPTEQSIIAMAMELNRWMTNPEHEFDEDVLGE